MFEDLKKQHYSVVYCDPPWQYDNFSGGEDGFGADSYYNCMTHQQLLDMPVNDLTAQDSVIVMWTTGPFIPDALELIEKWGFEYKTAGSWAKQTATGNTWAFGQGFHLRSAAEFYFIGTKGKPKVKDRSVRNLIVAQTRGHSRKPDIMYDNIEKVYDGPYLELFARCRRYGWDSWGNEVDKYGVVHPKSNLTPYFDDRYSPCYKNQRELPKS